jgi:O-antigen/teichoic acid export membrane protein
LRRWSGILSAYFTAQGITQAATLGAGLVLVRWLPVREFALYTLATSFLTTLAFLTDLGSTSSLLYFFRHSRQSGAEQDFPGYVGAVLELRRAAFGLAACLCLGLFVTAARREGFSWTEAALPAFAVLFCVLFQIDAALRVMTLRLFDRFGASYRAELLGAVLRLAGVVALIAMGLGLAWLALAVGAAAASLTAASAGGATLTTAPATPERRRAVLRYLLPTLPSALYFALQGPLVVWLAASFGGTRQIAEVGALGRLGLVVSLFTGLVGIVFLPRLARISDDALYRRRYVQFGLALLAFSALLVLAAAAVPDALLAVIGAHYRGLRTELLVVMTTAGLGLVSSFAVGVNLARSWTRYQALAALLMAGSQLAFVLILNLESTWGVLVFGMLSAIVGLLLQLAIGLGGFVSPRLVAWKPA